MDNRSRKYIERKKIKKFIKWLDNQTWTTFDLELSPVEMIKNDSLLNALTAKING